jgi:dienelactone hydrolase
MKRWLRRGLIAAIALPVLAGGALMLPAWTFDTETLPAAHGQVRSELFVGPGRHQPLIVGLGGGEGGNAWASGRWREQRQRFLDQGHAVLALGYFGMKGTPARLDRISLDGVHAAIAAAAADPRVDAGCIVVIGGSKGAELALLLASRHADIKAVVALVPSHVVFAGDTPALATSSFTAGGAPVPYVPVPWAAVPSLVSGDLRTAFATMLEDDAAVAAAAIPVERINGPILLMSAREDEYWPSTPMAEAIVARLDSHGFAFAREHVAVAGGHAEPLDEFARVEAFLDADVRQRCAED